MLAALRSARARGFSLIETMIVVCLVGVLATVAVVSYRRWTRSARLSEAQDIIAGIREHQESFFSENGAYVNVSNGLGPPNCYPSAHPGDFKTAWGASCTTCTATNAWETLGVHPTAPVAFGYSVIAGDGVKVLAVTSVTNQWGVPSIAGKKIDLTGLQDGRPWYFIEADGNSSGDGLSYAHVYGMSHTNQIYVDGEGN